MEPYPSSNTNYGYQTPASPPNHFNQASSPYQHSNTLGNGPSFGYNTPQSPNAYTSQQNYSQNSPYQHIEHELVNIDISHSDSAPQNVGRLIERKGGNTLDASNDRWRREEGKGHKHKHKHEEDEEDMNKNLLKVNQIFRIILTDRDCKKLFFFVSILSVVTCLEIAYGSWAGSLGLISAAFHSAFDCISLVISLAAMILAKHKPTKKFSYGYDRFEVLSSFSNGVFLLFVSLFLLFESAERLLEPEEIQSIHTQKLLFVAFLGLLVNIVGVVFFSGHSQTRSEVRHAHDENIYAIFIHVVVDAVGSIGVIISTWLMSMGWLMADPVVAIGIVCLIVYNSLPICNRTAKVLLQTTPLAIKDQLDKALREASTLEGVLECRNEHFWTQSPNVYVGSLYVRVRSDANEQMVLAKVHHIFAPLVTHFTVQIEKDDWVLPLQQQ